MSKDGPVLGIIIGSEIIELLGMPRKTRTFTIEVPHNAPVVVTCEYYPTEKQIRSMLPVLQKYELHKKGDPKMVSDGKYKGWSDEGKK